VEYRAVVSSIPIVLALLVLWLDAAWMAFVVVTRTLDVIEILRAIARILGKILGGVVGIRSDVAADHFLVERAMVKVINAVDGEGGYLMEKEGTREKDGTRVRVVDEERKCVAKGRKVKRDAAEKGRGDNERDETPSPVVKE
jgi:hypothetical protein